MQVSIFVISSLLLIAASCAAQSASTAGDAAVLEAAERRRPVHFFGSVSVAANTISQTTPCGHDGQLSIVTGTSISFFDDMVKRLFPNTGMNEVSIEFRDKLLCSTRTPSTAATPFAELTKFSVKCHTRRLFGGCSPVDILKQEEAASMPLPARGDCTSHRTFLPAETFYQLKDAIMTPTSTIDDAIHLTFNTSQALEQKTWQFPDGHSSKFFTRKFNRDQSVQMFGTLYDKFIAHETTDRFQLYFCQGVIYPDIPVNAAIKASQNK